MLSHWDAARAPGPAAGARRAHPCDDARRRSGRVPDAARIRLHRVGHLPALGGHGSSTGYRRPRWRGRSWISRRTCDLGRWRTSSRRRIASSSSTSRGPPLASQAHPRQPRGAARCGPSSMLCPATRGRGSAQPAGGPTPTTLRRPQPADASSEHDDRKASSSTSTGRAPRSSSRPTATPTTRRPRPSSATANAISSLTLAGYTVVRFTYNQVTRTPEAVANRLRRLLHDASRLVVNCHQRRLGTRRRYAWLPAAMLRRLMVSS